jgi:hypothetical protein
MKYNYLREFYHNVIIPYVIYVICADDTLLHTPARANSAYLSVPSFEHRPSA